MADEHWGLDAQQNGTTQLVARKILGQLLESGLEHERSRRRTLRSASEALDLVQDELCGSLERLERDVARVSIRHNDVEGACKDVGAFYKEKAAWMMECIKKYLPASCEPIEPKGGLFLWLKVPETLDLDKVWHKLMEANVGVVPSFGFSADPENYPGSAFRICYSTPSKEVIEEACQIMGRVLKEELGE